MAEMGRLPASPTILGAARTDLYGLHHEEILKQPPVVIGTGSIPHAVYGLKTPVDLEGLRADLIKRLQAELPRGASWLSVPAIDEQTKKEQ